MTLHEAQARLHTLRSLTSAAMHRAAEGKLDGALALAEQALARVEPVAVAYGQDEQAVDSLIACLAVICGLALEPGRAQRFPQAMEKGVRLYERAVRLRIEALAGQTLAGERDQPA